MKRNYVIKISLTIFSLLLVLLVGIDRVNAKSVTIIGNGGSLAGTNYGKLTMNGSALKGRLQEIGNASHIGLWEINNSTAFCIDPYIASTNAAEYKITTRDATDVITNKDVFKALNFALSRRNNKTAYAVGQAVAWGLITGKIDHLKASVDLSNSRYPSYKEFRIIYEVISDRYDSSNLSDKALTASTLGYMDLLMSSSSYFSGWKVWEGVCGGGQKYISKATPRLASEDIVCSGGCTGDNCETEPTPKCDAKGTISIAGECGVTSDYADPATLNDANWECMVTEKKEYYEDKYATPLGSKYNYCTFYCNEHVTTTYPGDDGYVFNAGSYFTVGMSSSGNLWGPIYVYGVRECRSYYNNGVKLTQGVNWKRFYSDLIKKELQLKREYNIWKQTLSRQIAGEQSSSSGYRSSKCYVCDTPYSDPSITDNSYCDDTGNGKLA